MEARTSRRRPLSTGDLEAVVQSSSIYGMLPSMISTRIPKIPSIRKTARTYSPYVAEAESKRGPEGRSGAATPPPRYSSIDVGGPSGRSSPTFFESGRETDGEADEAGVRWKYAQQGFSLLQLACRESSASDAQTSSFSRQIYLDALAYLLRGLPSDLNSTEASTIQSALPAHLQLSLHHDLTITHQSGTSPPTTQPIIQPYTSNKHPTLPHRLAATLTLNLILLLNFLLPYLKYFLAQAYAYERQHQLFHRSITASVHIADDIGTKSVKYAEVVGRIGDGKVGRVVGEAVLWWVNGVAGGVHEGVCEGMGTVRGARGQGRDEDR